MSSVAHVVLLGAMVGSYSVWKPAAPERTMAYLLDFAPVFQQQPLPDTPVEPPPPPAAGTREPLALPETAELPPPGSTTPPLADTGAGRTGVRGGRPGGRGLAGLAPVYGDSRVWSARPMYVPEGGGRPIDMDSMVRGRLLVMAGMLDSLSRLDTLSLAADRRLTAPSWIVERNGRRYGLDASGIHFGSFTLPSMLLAFLPLPQGNVDQARANQRLMEMRAEILRAAARAEAEDDFNDAVRDIRRRWREERDERREREERERRQPRPPAGEDRPRP